MNSWKRIVTKRPWAVIISSVAVIGLMGWYGMGLFNEITTSDQFTANGTESMQAKKVMEDKFGTTPTMDIVLFERKDQALGAADSTAYQSEVARLVAPLRDKANSLKTYADTQMPEFISKDKSMTYATFEGKGSEKEIYKVLSDFAANADQSKLNVSIGGASVVAEQMNETVSHDLARTEMITFPILLVLLVLFFGSAVAALVPLGISAVTIIGAFAVARLVNHAVAIDHYAVNVITILGIGLAIDYALLSVNRFREELHAHGSVERAVRLVVDTSGRTIFFSAVTVIACMLSLLVFPLDFLHSIAIGSASAVIVAMLFTVLVLPAVLMVIGKKIDAWHLPFVKRHTSKSRFWEWIANITTKQPVATLFGALAVIAVACVPLMEFKLAGAMDYHYLADGTSGRAVMQKMADDFESQTPGIAAVLTSSKDLSADDRVTVVCDMTTKLKAIPHVKTVVSPTMLPENIDCNTFKMMASNHMLPPQLSELFTQNAKGNAMRFSVALDVDNGTKEAEKALLAIRDLQPADAQWLVGGMEAYAYDTNQTYFRDMPKALAVIGASMLVLLAVLLASAIIPVQAIIINTISLAISFAVLIAVFQLGWGSNLTRWGTTDGIVMTPLILIAVIAFGLAMDYSVFLYSRMFEVHQKTDDTIKAVRQGIVKTGPIISAAAVMVFVVVAAFSASSVMLMRMIGVGLGVAVLIDAFFVRLLLVPSVMTLMGKASWYAPKWLKRLQIRHE